MSLGCIQSLKPVAGEYLHDAFVFSRFAPWLPAIHVKYQTIPIHDWTRHIYESFYFHTIISLE
ncbi:hypothetical protein ABIC51_006866 [Burkholderia sp. 572]